jgi:hypothetical protein
MHQFAHWKSAIHGAVTISEVQEVMEQYSASIAAGDKVTLPTPCKSVLRDVDIELGAETLIREAARFQGDAATASLLHEIAQTFVAAANRIAFLDGQAYPQDAASR